MQEGVTNKKGAIGLMRHKLPTGWLLMIRLLLFIATKRTKQCKHFIELICKTQMGYSLFPDHKFN